MLELRSTGVHPLQVLVHRKLWERLPGRLIAVNVHRVNSVRRLVSNWKGEEKCEKCVSLWFEILNKYGLRGICMKAIWRAYLAKWPSWVSPAYLHRPVFSRPETREWLERQERGDIVCVSENKHQVTRSRFAHKEDIWGLYWVSREGL